MRIVWEKSPFRIVELTGDHLSMEDLKGECFDFEKSGYTGTREDLQREETEFEQEVMREGVYGYRLEVWNPFRGKDKFGNRRYSHVDSCYGFVGAYNPRKGHKYNHYIVRELKESAKCLKAKTK